MVHRNAKLGLADRHALVSTVGGGMTLKQAVCRVQRDAGDSAPMVASLVGHERRGAEILSCRFDRSNRAVMVSDDVAGSTRSSDALDEFTFMTHRMAVAAALRECWSSLPCPKLPVGRLVCDAMQAPCKP